MHSAADFNCIIQSIQIVNQNLIISTFKYTMLHVIQKTSYEFMKFFVLHHYNFGLEVSTTMFAARWLH